MTISKQWPNYNPFADVSPSGDSYLDPLLQWYIKNVDHTIKAYIEGELSKKESSHPFPKDDLICEVVGLTKLRGKKSTQNIYEDTSKNMEAVEREATSPDKNINKFELSGLKGRLQSYLKKEELTIVKRKAEGYSHKEIAAEIGSSHDAVRQRYRRILTKIKALLEGFDY